MLRNNSDNSNQSSSSSSIETIDDVEALGHHPIDDEQMMEQLFSTPQEQILTPRATLESLPTPSGHDQYRQGVATTASDRGQVSQSEQQKQQITNRFSSPSGSSRRSNLGHVLPQMAGSIAMPLHHITLDNYSPIVDTARSRSIALGGRETITRSASAAWDPRYAPRSSVVIREQQSSRRRLGVEDEGEGQVFPCQARGIQQEHNAGNAVIYVPPNTKHGTILLCSNVICRSSGRQFRWCNICKIPAAISNFNRRHRHNTTTATNNQQPTSIMMKEVFAETDGD